MCGKCYLQLIQAHPSKDLGQTWKTWFSDAVVIPGRNSFVEGFIWCTNTEKLHTWRLTIRFRCTKTLENAVHFPTCLYDWLRLKYRNFPTKITLAKTVTEANAHFCHNLKNLMLHICMGANDFPFGQLGNSNLCGKSASNYSDMNAI